MRFSHPSPKEPTFTFGIEEDYRLVDLESPDFAPAPPELLADPQPHGEATEVKLGGFSAPTQDVSGAAGSARNDSITA